jgi:CO/xanthine dehydrogenase Mo-binding subunit
MALQEYKWMGKPLKVKEDVYPITGKATYLDDIDIPGTLYLAYVRSPVAHARIKRIDTSKALAHPGVVHCVTGEDVKKALSPFMEITEPPNGRIYDYPLAVDKVRYFGEPVAAIVATSRYAAEDAAELVEVEYEQLGCVLDAEEALKPGAPLVHDEAGTNLVWRGVWDLGSVDTAFAQADRVIKDKIYFHRYAPIPLEPSGVLATYDESQDSLTIYSMIPMPMFVIPMICGALRMPPSKVRMIHPPNIGGSFGGKIMSYTHATLVALLAKTLKRPVKYMETRTENIESGTHSNERTFHVEVAVKKDGTILGLRAKIYDNCGAYPRYEPAGAVIWSQVTPGVYAVKNIFIEFAQVMTNKGPTSPVRGYSRLQHNFMWEKLMDIVARELGLDPAEVRLRNLIKAADMPYTGPSGTIYDGGDYERAFRKLLDALEYTRWRKLQEEYRAKKRYIGIGFSAVIDSAANNFGQVKIINKYFPVSGNSEAAMVMIDQGGQVVARTGTSDTGQSHATTFAQIVAEELDMDPSRIEFQRGFDSVSGVWAAHSGAYASRSAVLAGTALALAARKLKEKVVLLAANLLKEDPANLVVKDGKVVSSQSGKQISFEELALIAWSDVLLLPEGFEPGLVSYYVYKPDFKNNLPDPKNRINNTLTYSYTMHGTVVEVDAETAQIKILKHVAVSDPGVMINPLVVEGQEAGAAIQGIEAALLDNLEYDDNGVLLASNFWLYPPITTQEAPNLEIIHDTTRSTSSLTGVRGVGEGGGGPVGSLANAVEDALSPFGVKIRSSHLSSKYLYSLLKKSGVKA